MKDIPGYDLLTQQLEDKTADSYSLMTPATQQAERCLKQKTLNAGLPYQFKYGFRSAAYQDHLREIWDKMEKLAALRNSKEIEACATTRAKVAAAKGCNHRGACELEECTAGGHCLVHRPGSRENGKHVAGNAFDVAPETVLNIRWKLANRKPPKSIDAFLNTDPPPCNLGWGGDWANAKDPDGDPVHFFVR